MDFDSLQEDSQKQDGGPKSFDSLPSDFDSLKDDSEKYKTTGQRAGAYLEGAAQGLAGPLAPMAEQALGVSQEDIAGREAQNPIEHGAGVATGLVAPAIATMGGSLLERAGLEGAGAAVAAAGKMNQAGILEKAAASIVPAGQKIYTQIASSALKGALEMYGFHASDEATKAVLGQTTPDEAVASAIGMNGVKAAGMGMLGGAAFGSAAAGLKGVANLEAGAKANQFMQDFGQEWHGMLSGGAGEAAAKGTPGQEAARAIFHDVIPAYSDRAIIKGAAIKAGQHIGGDAGALAAYQLSDKIANSVEKVIGTPIATSTKKYAVPLVLKILQSGATQDLMQALDHGNEVGSGVQAINRSMQNLFEGGASSVWDKQPSDSDRSKLKKYIEEGGVNNVLQQQQSQQPSPPQMFASGGIVQHEPPVTSSPLGPDPLFRGTKAISQVWPEQNTLMQTAKARVSNYLGGLKPQTNAPKLPFDSHAPKKEQERDYEKALELALQPMSVLNHIKQGTLTSKIMSHLINLYPELHSHLSNKIMEKVTEQQLSEDKPHYKLRQGLSTFLGQPLDSTMTPAAIMSIQAQYANTGAQPQMSPQAQGGKSKGSPSKLNSKVTQGLQTTDQARSARQTQPYRN